MQDSIKHIATQGERLDSIYAKYYGIVSSLNTLHYESGYNAFVLANIHLVSTPILKGGEIVYLPNLKETQESDEVLGIWE